MPVTPLPGALLFRSEDIFENIIGGLSWSLVQLLDVQPSEKMRCSAVPLQSYLRDWNRHFKEHEQAVWHRLEFSRYPQLS